MVCHNKFIKKIFVFIKFYSLGCYRLANFHEIIKNDHSTAGKIYKMSCDDMNYGHGCYRYGTFAFLGRGLKKSIS